MSNTITINRIDKGQGQLYVLGTIALSGSYVQVSGAGEVLDFTKAVLQKGGTLPVKSAPVAFSAWGMNGYGFGTVAWTGLTNKLKISTTAATELAAGAYPAGVTGDNIQFEAIFDVEL